MTMPSSGIESYKASTDRCPEAADNHYLPLRVSLEDLLEKKLLKALLACLGFLASFTDINFVNMNIYVFFPSGRGNESYNLIGS